MIAKVAAIVVLYHPNLDLLNKLLESLADQVASIIVVDNTEGTTNECGKSFAKWKNIKYIPLGENLGIAYAHNLGIHESSNSGYEYTLLLDQDSELSPGMVDLLTEAQQELVHSGVKVAAVGPLYVEEKNGMATRAIRYGWFGAQKLLVNPADKFFQTDCLIASGSLIQISVFKKIGPMLEELFIDCVDTEWGLRAQKCGWKSFIVPRAIMSHSIGDKEVKFLGRSATLHSDVRHYYIVRNTVRLFLSSRMNCKWRIHVGPRLPYHMLLYSMKSGNPVVAFKLITRALLDGLFRQMGRI